MPSNARHVRVVAGPQRWVVRGHGGSDVGRERQRNEDSLLIDEELGLYVVADGMGGHRAGDVASRAAVDAVDAFVRKKGATDLARIAKGELDRHALKKIARRAVAYAARCVYEKALSDPRYSGMGTTLTLLIAAGPHGVLAHVGDSRAYRMRDGSVEQLTRDHTITAELLNLGVIEPDEVRNHPMRNCLSRALGIRPVVRPDMAAVNLRPGDRFLLCSDGLHGYIPDTTWLSQALQAPMGEIPDALIAFANQAGGNDNITSVVVDVQAVRHSGVVARGEDEEEESGVVVRCEDDNEEASGFVVSPDPDDDEDTGVIALHRERTGEDDA